MNKEEQSIVFDVNGQQVIIERGKGITKRAKDEITEIICQDRTPAEKNAIAANDLLNASQNAELRKLSHKKAVEIKKQAIFDEQIAEFKNNEAAKEQVLAASMAVMRASVALRAARAELPAEKKILTSVIPTEKYSVEEAEILLKNAPQVFDQIFITRNNSGEISISFDKHFWLLDDNMQLLNDYLTDKWEEKSAQNVEKKAAAFANKKEFEEYKAERNFAKDLTVESLKAVQGRIYATIDSKDVLGKQFDFRLELLKETRDKLLNVNVFGLTSEQSKKLLAKSIGLKQKTVVENEEKVKVDNLEKLDEKKHFRKTGKVAEFEF